MGISPQTPLPPLIIRSAKRSTLASVNSYFFATSVCAGPIILLVGWWQVLQSFCATNCSPSLIGSAAAEVSSEVASGCSDLLPPHDKTNTEIAEIQINTLIFIFIVQ